MSTDLPVLYWILSVAPVVKTAIDSCFSDYSHTRAVNFCLVAEEAVWGSRLCLIGAQPEEYRLQFPAGLVLLFLDDFCFISCHSTVPNARLFRYFRHIYFFRF
jgi:hypothetical protein